MRREGYSASRSFKHYPARPDPLAGRGVRGTVAQAARWALVSPGDGDVPGAYGRLARPHPAYRGSLSQSVGTHRGHVFANAGSTTDNAISAVHATASLWELGGQQAPAGLPGKLCPD